MQSLFQLLDTFLIGHLSHHDGNSFQVRMGFAFQDPFPVLLPTAGEHEGMDIECFGDILDKGSWEIGKPYCGDLELITVAVGLSSSSLLPW